jgi:RimJ/RimL family protein N-acetyltransferase
MVTIKLRALTQKDINKTLIWNNDKVISDLYSGHPFPVNLEMEQKWYDKILTSNFPTTVFGIENIASNELVGICMLKDINLINRTAEYAIYIGEKEYRGKGFSKEATLQVLDFGFKKLGLNKIFLKVLEENNVAISLYKKVGFIQEGILRESIFKNNQFKNELLLGLLRKEFNGGL